MNQKESLEFDALWESMWKCKRGKVRKASVARFVTNGIDSVLGLEEKLQNGTYQPRKPHEFELTYPKRRKCSSTHISDRVVQRSMNDNVVYPTMTKGFIYDNMACQIGKGTTRAMDRLNTFLHRYYINNGNSSAGYVLQCDIKGYYDNMSHKIADACFRSRLGDETTDMCMAWMKRQYPGDIGFAPGSQMVQILGISFLDKMDHYVKEQLRSRNYIRYMDDFYIIDSDYQYLVHCREELEKQVESVGLKMHPTKTRIYPLKDGIRFLGFTFCLTETGKVLRILDPKNVKHERKRLYKLAQKVKRGEITREKFDECYKSWKSHAKLGNSYKLLLRMDQYVQTLFTEGNTDENYSADRFDFGTPQNRQCQGYCREGGRYSRIQHYDGNFGRSG